MWRWYVANWRTECSTEIESGGDPGVQLIQTFSTSSYAPLSSDVQTTKMSSVVWYKRQKYQEANISTWTAICTCDYARDPKSMEEVKFSYVFIFLLIKITISMSLINLMWRWHVHIWRSHVHIWRSEDICVLLPPGGHQGLNSGYLIGSKDLYIHWAISRFLNFNQNVTLVFWMDLSKNGKCLCLPSHLKIFEVSIFLVRKHQLDWRAVIYSPLCLSHF